jgi:hypothetical protein
MIPALLTYTGILFDLLNPDPERIALADVAHALARIMRFTGHGDQAFTDAQHSVLVCDLCPPELKRWGLLHDAEEAYIGDISSPEKEAMRQLMVRCFGSRWTPYDEIGRNVRAAVSLRFGVPITDVKYWDDQAALLEISANGPRSSADYTWPLPEVTTEWVRGPTVWPVELSEFMFLLRCKELGIQ